MSYDTYQFGLSLVVLLVFGFLFVVVLIELSFALNGWESLGTRIERWALHNEWYSSGFLLVVAVLLAHFFLNPLAPTSVGPLPTALP